MQTNELILYLRKKVENAKKRKIQGFSDLIEGNKLLEAADRLEELEGECKSLANNFLIASNIVGEKNERIDECEKIAAFYHRELEKKCEEIEKLKPKPNKRERLKRCPFCGGKARIMKCPVGMYSGLYIVGCDKDDFCYANINRLAMVFTSKEIAEEAWNRRAGDEQKS